LSRAQLLASLLLSACGAGVQANSGIEALLRVSDAQYFHGAFPTATTGAPSVTGLSVKTQTLRVGQVDRALSGSASKDAVSVAFTLDGDPGYWVRPMGGTDPVLTDSLAFEANLGFSRFITSGDHNLLVAASNTKGEWGAAQPLTFTFVDPAAAAPAALQVRLRWDVDADLDLHVVQPDGFELWARKITAYEAPVIGPPDQDAANAAGHLDFDSNGGCRLDGLRVENVLYGKLPAAGTYTVRVDAPSLCGQAAARWTVEVLKDNTLISTVSGIALPSATRFPHERGAGVLATQFTLP
jgi:hypothetical protein